MGEGLNWFGQLFFKSFNLYRRNFLPFFAWGLVLLGPLGVWYSYLDSVKYFPDLILIFLVATGQITHGTLFLISSAATILLTVMVLLSFQIVLIRMLTVVDKQEKIRGQVLRKDLGRLFLPYGALMGLGVWKLFLWSLVFLVPAVFFGVLYSFAGLAFLVDNYRGMEALRESKRIIQSQALRFCSSMLGLFLFLGLLFLLGDIWLPNIFGFNDPGEVRLFPTIGESIFFGWVLALNSFGMIFSYFLYQDLKQRTS